MCSGYNSETLVIFLLNIDYLRLHKIEGGLQI